MLSLLAAAFWWSYDYLEELEMKLDRELALELALERELAMERRATFSPATPTMPQKVKMEVDQSIAAGATIDNVLTGKRFERAPFNGFLKLLQTGSAAGLTSELNVGGRSASPADPVSSQNRTPIEPDDVVIDEVEAMQGELIQLTVRNPTAGALTYRARVFLSEGYLAG